MFQIFQQLFFTRKASGTTRCDVEKEGEGLGCHVSQKRRALMDLLFPRKHTNGKFRLHHLFRSSADASPDDNEINCFTSVNIICTNLYTASLSNISSQDFCDQNLNVTYNARSLQCSMCNPNQMRVAALLIIDHTYVLESSSGPVSGKCSLEQRRRNRNLWLNIKSDQINCQEDLLWLKGKRAECR